MEEGRGIEPLTLQHELRCTLSIAPLSPWSPLILRVGTRTDLGLAIGGAMGYGGRGLVADIPPGMHTGDSPYRLKGALQVQAQ